MAKKNKPLINHKMNPAVAYAMGYEAGLKESNIQGFMASNIMQLLAFYNVVGDHIKTEKTQANIAKAMEIEMARLFAEEFQISPATDNRGIKFYGTKKRNKMRVIQ